jgi:hypothetical protein
MCKTKTSPNFGGDPSYECPICDTAAACKNEARDDDERNDFYDVESKESYRCYCLVIKKENDRGQSEEMEGDDLFIPYEFNIPKSSFAALSAKIERSHSRPGAPPLGLLDPEKGSDLWAIRDKKNSLTFDLSEEGPVPIFTLDDQFEAKLTRVWKQMRQPSVKFLADERMLAIADMVAERAFEKAAKSLSERSDEGGPRNRGDRGDAPRGRSRETDDAPSRGRGRFSGVEDSEQERPAPARSRGSFARAQAALGNDDGQQGAGGEDDQIPGAEVPPRRSPHPASVNRQAPAPEEAPADSGADEAPPVSSSRGGSTARAAAPARVSVPPAVAATRRPIPAPTPTPKGESSGRIEDEAPGEGDPAPEETDPAPPAQAERAPVTAPARPAPARGALHGALRNSVSRLASTGR